MVSLHFDLHLLFASVVQILGLFGLSLFSILLGSLNLRIQYIRYNYIRFAIDISYLWVFKVNSVHYVL